MYYLIFNCNAASKLIIVGSFIPRGIYACTSVRCSAAMKTRCIFPAILDDADCNYVCLIVSEKTLNFLPLSPLKDTLVLHTIP